MTRTGEACSVWAMTPALTTPMRSSGYGTELLIGSLVAAVALKEAGRRAHPYVARATAVSRVDAIIVVAVVAEAFRRLGAVGR